MDDFRNAIDMSNLFYAGFVGHKFTWKRITNISGQEKIIWERLDKFFINHDFRDLCSMFSVKHLGFFSSDHRMILSRWDWITNGSTFHCGGKTTSSF